MAAVCYLIGLLLVAQPLREKVALLRPFPGLTGYCCSVAFTLFLAAWSNLALYMFLGWGVDYQIASGGVLAGMLAWLYLAPARQWPGLATAWRTRAWPHWRDVRRFSPWFAFLFAMIWVRYLTGIRIDHIGQVWTNFNFVDTAYHLSVVNAFRESAHFPPMDLDLAPFPLKYHFLADFMVAHLAELGMGHVQAMRLMNAVSGAVMVGALWATFSRWLRLKPFWIMLAGLVFFFDNTSIVNVVHYVTMEPRFFDPLRPMDGMMLYPYFNFEAVLNNLFEPQRAITFSFPVLLLILDAGFARTRVQAAAEGVDEQSYRQRLLWAFALVCLMPFGHVVGFAVSAASLGIVLLYELKWFVRLIAWWLPLFATGVLQLYYVLGYGPPIQADFENWDVATVLPLADFRTVPSGLRRVCFWLSVNGDFLVPGALFVLLGWIFYRKRRTSASAHAPLLATSTPAGPVGQIDSPEPLPASLPPATVWEFVRQWRWFLVVAISGFVLINFYRYSFAWGDSNKFVLFLNLGLSLIITLGLAELPTRRLVTPLLAGMLLVHCAWPAIYKDYRDLIQNPEANTLLFQRNSFDAARWLREHRKDDEKVLTAAYNLFHFVTPLAGAPTYAGIYGDANPYRQVGMREAIRQIYEEDNLTALRRLGARYLCLSRAERRRYHIHPHWFERMKSGEGVAHMSGRLDEYDAVYLFDCTALTAHK